MLIHPPIIAHRGASRYAPENTLAAFRKAKELGARWVEFDVMLSKDHEAVVIHDDTLERTTNGSGNVSDHTCVALKKLDAGSWFSPEFANEKIPTFLEVIQLLNELQLCANVEIKPLPGKEKITAEKTLSIIQAHWPRTLPAPLISSFSRIALETVRNLSSDSLLGFLMDEWLPDWQIVCDQLQCVSVHVDQKILTPDLARQIKATQRLLLAYTVNALDRAKALFSAGVDAIFCDDLLVMQRDFF